MKINFSLLFLITVIGLLGQNAEAQTYRPRLKICKSNTTGELQARRACRGSYTTRISANDLFTGKIISLTAHGSTIESSSSNVISVTQNSTGVYTVETTIPDVRQCNIVASPLSSGAFTVSAYGNNSTTSQIFVDTFHASSGTSFDVTYHLLAYCP